MWKCPNCSNEIDSLCYSVETRENGYVNLYDNEGLCQASDYESNDNDWTGDVEYCCPECDEYVNLSDLILITDEEKELEEEKKELEEEKFNIIKPEINLQIEKNNIDQTENTMICKHCFYVFVYSTEKNGSNEDFTDCPNCGQQNNKEEYKKLIISRFFEKIKIKRLRKKHAKKTKSRRVKPLG